MDSMNVVEAVGNVDRRLERVEQILPTLATKQDLEPLATKEELLEVKGELSEALVKLSTRQDQLELKIMDEGETSRRYMKVLVEHLEAKIDIYAERMTAVDERDARQHTECLEANASLDKRVTALEASPPRRRR